MSPASSVVDFRAFVNLFNHMVTKVLCRPNDPNITSGSITWCVQIAYLEENVEVCVRPGPDLAVDITYISCEAELLGLANYLSFPSVSFIITMK